MYLATANGMMSMDATVPSNTFIIYKAIPSTFKLRITSLPSYIFASRALSVGRYRHHGFPQSTFLSVSRVLDTCHTLCVLVFFNSEKRFGHCTVYYRTDMERHLCEWSCESQRHFDQWNYSRSTFDDEGRTDSRIYCHQLSSIRDISTFPWHRTAGHTMVGWNNWTISMAYSLRR